VDDPSISVVRLLTMAEENIEVLQTSQDTPPAEGSESTPQEQSSQEGSEQQPSGQGSEQGDGEQSEHSEGTQGENSEGQPEQQGAKPTRVERRIGQLLDKLKGSHGASSEQPGVPGQSRSKFFTDEELAEGAIDPSVLEKRIGQTVQQEVQQALEMDRINQQYTSAVKEHEADLESVKDLDPKIEELAVKQYEVINYQINPLTGEKMFIPAVKMSEIVKKLTDVINSAAENVAQGNRVYAENVSQNQAVPTNGSTISSKPVKENTTDFGAFEKAYSPRA